MLEIPWLKKHFQFANQFHFDKWKPISKTKPVNCARLGMITKLAQDLEVDQVYFSK